MRDSTEANAWNDDECSWQQRWVEMRNRWAYSKNQGWKPINVALRKKRITYSERNWV